jgi:DNA-binding beta-propeller fold protein YncE
MDGQRGREAAVISRVGSGGRHGARERGPSTRGLAVRAYARLLAVLSVVLAASLCSAGAALAAGTEEHVARQHVLSFSFGGQGNGDGQFAHPAGIAVNDSTGAVYVADREGGRVEEFTTVLDAEDEPTAETYAAELSVPFPEEIAVDDCTSECSNDPSVGDVYVAGAKNAKAEPTGDTELYKFDAAGAPIGTPRKFKEPIEGVAVNSSGSLFVYEQGGGIAIFGNAELNLEGTKPGATVRAANGESPLPGLAIDSEGDIYAGAALNAVDAGKDVGLEQLQNELISEYGFLHENEKGGEAEPVVAKLGGAGELLVPALDYEATTAVAVNPVEVPANGVDEKNEVFVTNVANVAGEQLSTVAIFGPEPEPEGAPVEERHGKLIQRLDAPGLTGADGIAVDSATGAVYVTGGTSDTVDVFTLEPRGVPSVGDLSARSECKQEEEHSAEPCSTSPSVTLRAQVNSAGVETHYDFEYGAGSSTCRADPSSCTAVPAPPASAGTEFGGNEVSVELANLAPGVYHYRVIAEAPGHVVRSPEQTFTIVAPVSGLPDGRAWEMVSPPEKDGAEAEALTREGGTIQAAANGDAITYVTDGPVPANVEPEGNRNPEPTQVLSIRKPDGGWESQDIVTKNETGAGVSPGHTPEYQFFSSNLALALVDPFYSVPGSLARPPLSPRAEPSEAGKQESTIYLRHDAPLTPEASSEETKEEQQEDEENYKRAEKDGVEMDEKEGATAKNAGFLALVTKMNQPGTEPFGEELDGFGIVPQGATPDLSHVVFQSYKAAPGLYEWGGAQREKEVQLVSALPGTGERVPTKFAGLGGEQGDPQSADARHAISSDGSLVFWTDSGNNELHLFVRDTKTRETLQLDKLQPKEGPPEPSEKDSPDPVFQTASADGKRVYFTDTQRLTANSKAVDGSPDLYVFELETESAPLSGRLVDLTPETGADVLAEGESGGVLGASEEAVEESRRGAYVYFVADGALAPNTTRGQCSAQQQVRPPGSTCNLYVRHFDEATQEWEPTKLVAVLSSEDNPDWGGASTEGNLKLMTSRVSPNGEYLAFMSDRSLTGYDNEDVSSKKPGERLDEEVYLYNAHSGNLVCASCNPSGARPQGVLDLGQSNTGGSGEGLGLVVDRSEAWARSRSAVNNEDNWLSGSIPGWTAFNTSSGLYQSRYLSNSGRLFFDSADALVPLQTPTREEAAPGEKLTVGVENVYEYEPGGVGSCASEGGCLGLMSSGTSPHESAFLDASVSGNDVFFVTAAQLAPQDQDTNFDVYDARVCGTTCPTAPAAPPAQCEGEECLKLFESELNAQTPTTAASSGSGNLGQISVLGKKEEKPVTKKPLTRAQKLAAALKACKKDKKKNKRVACEKQARKKVRHEGTKKHKVKK